MITGDASAIVNVATSIDRNLNGCGYCLITDSPATDEWDTPYCPPSVIEEGGNCFSAPPTDGTCPEGTVPDIKNEGQSCVPSNY